MLNLRVKVIYRDGAWTVDLPQYSMLPGSFLPLIPSVVHANGVYPDVYPNDPRLSELTCEVVVPDRLCNPTSGRVDVAAIHKLYRGQPRFGDTDWTPEI